MVASERSEEIRHFGNSSCPIRGRNLNFEKECKIDFLNNTVVPRARQLECILKTFKIIRLEKEGSKVISFHYLEFFTYMEY